jgi:sugar/nucleoside kinase (ribokinase family)
VNTVVSLVIAGQFSIDDVVLPTGQTHMGSVGGDALYAAIGARLAGAVPHILAVVGADFHDPVLAVLAEAGLDTSGIGVDAGPTQRTWVIYEEDGRRRFLDRTSPDRFEALVPDPGLLPPQLAGVPALHLAAMPLASQYTMLSAFRRRWPTGVVSLDTHEALVAGYQEDLAHMAREVTVLLPSDGELADWVGHRDWPRALRELSALGPKVVGVKQGKDGSLIYDAMTGHLFWVSPPPVTVVDPTGAGDAYCGAFMAAYAAGQGIVEAARIATAAAALAIGTVGATRFAARTPDELTRILKTIDVIPT